MNDEPLPKMVSAMFPQPLDAVHAMDALETFGYARTEMNILMTEKGASFQSDETSASEGNTSPATAVGAVLASLAAVGAATGAFIGRYGLPDPKEPTYAEALKTGAVIVGVAPHDRPGEVAAVEAIYRQFNGQHIFHGGR